MKTALYPRLAWDGLRKNKRLFTPYLLTCICMVMMFYILSFLGSPETCALLPRGSNTTGKILNLGSFVIFVFSAIFLYYTNSFLVRRREREFGLYNVLGMNKRNLARIVTWESLITAALSLVLGLALGIVLSKLAELGLVNMLGGDINYRIRIDVDSLTRAGTVRDHLRGHLALHGRPRRAQQRRGAAAQRVRRRKAAEGKLAARPCGRRDPRRGVLPCREHHQPA